MSSIEAINIKKVYKMGETKVHALRGVSVKIEKGDFVVIVGPSGSGKSTLMHILGALDTPSHGKVLLEGKDISDMDEWSLAMIRRKKIGFIFQTFNLIPTLTALENVMIPLEPTNVPEEDALRRAKKLLTDVGLDDRMLHKPNELSGGQRQRVSIARALINEPEIIIADEPTGNLDTATGDHVIEIMRTLNEKEGKTFIIVTHDESLLKFATKKFYLKDGLIHKSVSKKNMKKYAG